MKDKIIVADIAVGDVFSESAHYVVESISAKTVQFKHTESGEQVSLSHKYVESLLETADQYQEEKQVTREDSTSGKGIRSIFEEIGTSQVFTVVFQKQGTTLTKKELATKKQLIVADAVSKLSNKGRMSPATITSIIGDLLDKGVSEVVPGEDRTLRGYKIDFTSRDGKYNCIDMDIKTGNPVRPVNINTIKSLVIGGTKYIVK